MANSIEWLQCNTYIELILEWYIFFCQDYSLLVALDDVKRELVVGIIDYLRPYDALKFAK